MNPALLMPERGPAAQKSGLGTRSVTPVTPTQGGVTGVEETQLPYEEKGFVESLVSASGREVKGDVGSKTT